MKMELITEYFGGYGKVTQDLVAFNEFYEKIKFL
jgi:hypothetical protein